MQVRVPRKSPIESMSLIYKVCSWIRQCKKREQGGVFMLVDYDLWLQLTSVVAVG